MPQYPSSTENSAPWTLALTRSAAAAVRVRAWWEQARAAYPPTTLRAWKFDWAAFDGYCSAHRHTPLPARPATVAGFVESSAQQGKKPATIRRYLATIALAHRVAKLENPCRDELVQLALKGVLNRVSSRQRQARALGRAEIKRFIDTAGTGIRADRERALLTVAYDTMARRSELVALDMDDLTFQHDGTGIALIRRSKTDQAGLGTSAYLSRETVQLLRTWISQGNLKSGPLFRRIVGRVQLGDRLNVDSIAEIFKRVATWVGLEPADVAAVSGHSIRVGATQDLLALNIDLSSIMQAGRWTTTRMPHRYGENLNASRGGMAKAAAAQGR